MSGLLELSEEFKINEKIQTEVFRFFDEANKVIGREIFNLIQTASPEKKVVLGLSTGSSPSGVYDELIRLHKEEGLSFRNVVTFNVDEYYPIDPKQTQSYSRFMAENLFSHIDILPENIHLLSGDTPSDQVEAYTKKYEEDIKKAGGIDLLLIPLGKGGVLGFNSSGTSKDSKTRLVEIDRNTRIDAASDFFGAEYVPLNALTLGVSNIYQSKRIILVAYSEGRSRPVARVVEGDVSISVPATFLQNHHNIKLYIDEAAAQDLLRFKNPWVIQANVPLTIKWNPFLARKAVIWLSLTLGKPILKLVDDDYYDNHLTSLLNIYGPAHDLNLKVFHHIQGTITGWPGGRPIAQTQANSPDAMSPNLKSVSPDGNNSPSYGYPPALPYPHKISWDIHSPKDKIIHQLPPPKRVAVFSPHPDDDVISMGGTLIRLCDQGHEVHVAYQTSGNIAVWDDDAKRFANFATQFARIFGLGDSAINNFQKIEDSVEDFIKGKLPAQIDSKEVQKIKGLIRQTEARAAARYAGVLPSRIHFLDLPFYETGAVKKKPLGEEDIQIVVQFLQKTQPQQIYAAGDLSDPHGTHRVCLKAVLAAINALKHEPWMQECQIWLYRGAWQEWEPERIEMAVPLSPREMLRKRLAIFKHQSQKDVPLFPGADKREFWQRAEERNRNTAQLLDKLGFTEYEGTEAFIRWHIDNKWGTNPI